MNLLQAIGLLAGLATAAQADEQARPAERYVRIGHYQCRCRQGDFETNRKTVLHGLTLAEEARVQIMTFPESFNDPLEHYQTVRSDHTARAIENGVYFVRGNNCVAERRLPGLADEGHGYGESYVINPNGQLVAGAGLYDEYLMLYNLDLNKRYRSGGIRRSRESAVALLDVLRPTLQSDAPAAKSPPK